MKDITEDGKVFYDKSNFERYKKNLHFYNTVDSLKVFELSLPEPITGTKATYRSSYRWYYIEDEIIYKKIFNAYKPYLEVELKRAEIICLEFSIKNKIVNCFTIKEVLNYVEAYTSKLLKTIASVKNKTIGSLERKLNKNKEQTIRENVDLQDKMFKKLYGEDVFCK